MIEMSVYRFFVMLIIVWILIIILILLMLKLFSTIQNRKKIAELAEERIQENLINKFYETLEIVSNQTTPEILECLIEMEKLDETYKQICEKDDEFMNEITYLELKESTLNKIIDEKIKVIENSSKKKEKLKGLLGELQVCQERYPQYNTVYVDKKNAINDKLVTQNNKINNEKTKKDR